MSCYSLETLTVCPHSDKSFPSGNWFFTNSSKHLTNSLLTGTIKLNIKPLISQFCIQLQGETKFSFAIKRCYALKILRSLSLKFLFLGGEWPRGSRLLGYLFSSCSNLLYSNCSQGREDLSGYREVVSQCKAVLEDSKNAICQISSANVAALLERIEKEEKERERQERNVLTGKSLFEMLEQIFPTFDKG